MLQGIINRLAANSASCKTWCVTLVSALAVVAADKQNVNVLLVAGMPILLFGAFDAYYPGLERRFRECYESFATKLHEGRARVEDVFIVAPQLARPRKPNQLISRDSLAGIGQAMTVSCCRTADVTPRLPVGHPCGWSH
jgi:hypothetical protein